MLEKLPILVTKKKGPFATEYIAKFSMSRSTEQSNESFDNANFDLNEHLKEHVAKGLHRDIMDIKTSKLYELKEDLLKVAGRNNREVVYIQSVFDEIFENLDFGYRIIDKTEPTK